MSNNCQTSPRDDQHHIPILGIFPLSPLSRTRLSCIWYITLSPGLSQHHAILDRHFPQSACVPVTSRSNLSRVPGLSRTATYSSVSSDLWDIAWFYPSFPSLFLDSRADSHPVLHLVRISIQHYCIQMIYRCHDRREYKRKHDDITGADIPQDHRDSNFS